MFINTIQYAALCGEKDSVVQTGSLGGGVGWGGVVGVVVGGGMVGGGGVGGGGASGLQFYGA